MNISIMQPYLFPYIGYFQMINSSDCFVIDDNVQYINKGWINRNRILLNGNDHLITLPVAKGSSRLNINERYFVDDPDRTSERKILNTIYHAYHKAPNYKECYELIETILYYNNKNVSEFTSNSLKRICDYLGLEFKMLFQSQLNPPSELDYQDSIIYLCKKLNADCYINAIGGMDLYSSQKFTANNLVLKFIKTRESVKYNQFNNDFIPNLSIIDVMMFNSQVEIKKLLHEYDLINGRN